MDLPNPNDVGEKAKQNPWLFALGLILILVAGFVYHSSGHLAKWVFEEPHAKISEPKPELPKAAQPRNEPNLSEAAYKRVAAPTLSTNNSQSAPTSQSAPVRASVPPPAAPQQATVETPAAPVAPRTPEPPLPCAHVTLPIKPAALATSADRICAIAVCSGQPADAPAIDAVRKWLALARAKSGAKCDVADREALGDDAVLKRLLAIAATEPATKNGIERLSCFDAREAINDELQKASEKLQTSIDDAKRCGAKAQKETSDAVTAVVQALQ